jgi:PAS domain S-box-containing protein
MSAAEAKVSNARIQRTFVPYLFLLFSLAITLLFSLYVYRSVRASDQTRFNTGFQDLTTYVRGRPRLYVEVLRAATGLFAANPSINPKAFHKFVERLELAEQYPGAGGIGFLGHVKRSEKESFIATKRKEGLKDFQISPENGQAEYNPVIYYEALDQHNQIALGYDMFTDPTLRAALERARDTGLPAASGRVMLGGTSPAGFFIYVPIYRNDETPRSVDDRRATLSGFVYAQFRAADLIGSIIATRNFGAIDMQIYDAPLPDAEHLLQATAHAASDTQPPASPLKAASTVDVAGRTWFLAFAARPEFYSSSWSVYFTALGGLLVSLVVFVLTRSQVMARSAAERGAAELRVTESKVRKTLSDRERAEEALRESEERYRELIENANDIIYTLDLAGSITSMNKAGELITGYTRAELLQMNIDQLFTPEAMSVRRQMLARKLAGEARTNYEVEARNKAGVLVTLEISSRLVHRDGEAFGVHCIARDISERRRAEEALRQADQRALNEYERLLERISRLAQALGTSRDVVSIYRALGHFCFVSVPCDGFFVSLYDPVREVRTACYGWGDGLELDVSELPPMPITAAGPNSRAVMTGEIIITDDFMSARRGVPPVIAGPDNGRRPQSSLAAPMAVMGRIIGTIEVQSYQLGAYREGHVTAMRMAANLTAVAIENVRLLEQETRDRAAAEDSNRLKDEFLATVSHELRTPLTAILGWSRMLEAGDLDQATTARAIETIRRNARNQAEIIDDILDVSRIITGHLYLDLTPVDLAPIIEAAINVVRPTAEAKRIEITEELGSQPTVVSGDAKRLQQVIWNLLSNAIKFTPSGGRVQIALDHSGPTAEIKVQDSGQGISRDFLPFIFDRFRQADSSTTRQHGGLGLGLAIARHLVEIHGGTVHAESLGENQGATFTVKLPRISSGSPAWRDDHKATSAETALGDSLLSGVHVLLVDDDVDSLEVLTAALKTGKATITAVLSTAAALAEISAIGPDVIVSDLAMPVEDGYELIQRVRALEAEHLREIPALAITAYAREEDRERALASGYSEYMAKPIEPAQLISMVAKLVAKNGDQESLD